MSRIGNKPITVPENVEVKIDGHHIEVKGPKGTLERDIHKNMTVTMDGNVIKVTRPRDLHKNMTIVHEGNTIKVERSNDQKENRSLHGLTRTLISNMIEGVVNEYKRELEINGVGYRAQKKGNKLVMNLGYSHPVEIDPPEGITFDVPAPNQIIVRGIDKEVVGQTAAVIRTKRPPEVYRGKGIKYVEEHIRRKEGKAGKK